MSKYSKLIDWLETLGYIARTWISPAQSHSPTATLYSYFKQLCSTKQWGEAFNLLATHPYYRSYKSIQKEMVTKLLAQVCEHGDLEVAIACLSSPKLKARPDVNVDFGMLQTPLTLACRYGHMEIVRYLLVPERFSSEFGTKDFKHSKADIHCNDDMALNNACISGQLHVVRYLLTSPEIITGEHANIHAAGESALMSATYMGHLEIVKYLLTSQEILDAGGSHAFLQGNATCARKNYPLIYPSASDQCHALLQAVLAHNLKIVKFLLASEKYFHDHGQSFSQQDKEKAFEVAVIRDYIDIVHYMIFDYDIEYSKRLQEFVQEKDHNTIKSLFERRELHKGLQANLNMKPAEKPSRTRKI